MIHVVFTVDLHPGKRDAWLAELRKVISDIRAEAGCLEYVPTYDAETDIGNQFRLGSDRVVVVEKWQTIDHLKGHMVAPHMQAYRPTVKDFVKSVELRVLSPA